MNFSIEKLLLSTLWRLGRSSGQRGIRKATLFVSVGHTAHSEVNSGIQRVTRSIAKEVLKQYEDSDLLEWFLKKNRYILLDEAARKKFARYSGPVHQPIDECLREEREALFSPLSNEEESGWETLCSLIASEGNQANFRNRAGWWDRTKMAFLLRWIRKCRLRLAELENEEKAIQGPCVAEISKRMKAIRSLLESLHECFGESDGVLGEVKRSPKRSFDCKSRAEKEMLTPIVADPFAAWAMARVSSDELTTHFENLVGRLDRSGFRPLNWVSYVPVPRALRRELRRCIRKFDNARQEASDRKWIRGFIDEEVGARLTLDRFRSAHQRILDRKSDCEADLFTALFEIQTMQKSASDTELTDRMREFLKRIDRLRRRLYPRQFVPPKGSWVLIPELMTSEEFENVFSFAKIRELKVAVVFHDALPIQFPDLVSARYREDHERYMRVIAQADFLLPVSEYSKMCYLDWAKGSGVDVPRIEVCLNGVQFKDKPKKMDEHTLPERIGSDFALCVSTVEPRKNHLKLLEAWRNLLAEGMALPQLVLVGNAYTGFEDLAESVDEICKVEQGIVWLKGVSDEDLETLYARCRFTVFPSIAEGFGLPILESLWYCSPCLCASFGAMEEVARGGGCVRVDMRDVEAIENGIRSMVGDESLMASLEQECLKRQMRTWSDYAAQVGQILELEASENE